MFPGAKGVAVEPAPQIARAGTMEPEGYGGELASEGLNLNDETWEKSGPYPVSRMRLKGRESAKGESLTPIADNLTRCLQPGNLT